MALNVDEPTVAVPGSQKATNHTTTSTNTTNQLPATKLQQSFQQKTPSAFTEQFVV